MTITAPASVKIIQKWRVVFVLLVEHLLAEAKKETEKYEKKRKRKYKGMKRKKKERQRNTAISN